MPPLHPVLVHFPIAILPLGLVLELATVVTKREQFSRVGWWVQLLGTIGLLGATLSGLLVAHALIAPQEVVRLAIENHEQFACAADAVFALLLFWRIGLRTQIPTRRKTLFLLAYAVGVGLVVATGLFGGEMVYGFGVGVRG
jgi:uncharacterized membrane protein